MDSTIHNVLLDLKILSMVEPKGRLCLINGVLAVEPQTFWLPVKRYIWNIDRNILYQRIKQRVLELETLFIQQMINEDWIKEEITKLLEQASPKIAEALQPKNEKEAGKLKQTLDEAGWRTENATQILSTLKVVSAGFGFFLGGGVALFTNGIDTYSLI